MCFKTEAKELALTFDACGGYLGNQYDEELISFLRDEEIHDPVCQRIMDERKSGDIHPVS